MASATDKVFLNSERYIDHVDYHGEMICPVDAAEKTKERAREVREVICDLVVQHKLDAIDLQIIAERDCSPVPTLRDIAMRLGISHVTVLKRVTKIKALLSV